MVDFKKLLERSIAREQAKKSSTKSEPTPGAFSLADLSHDQRVVHDAALDWMSGNYPSPRSASLFTIGGLAGCGKTTVLGVIVKELVDAGNTIACITVTGRASSILARKMRAAGVDMTGLLRPNGKGEGDPRFYDSDLPRRGGPPFVGTLHRLIYKPLINDKEELIGWRKREELDRKYSLIVIDEASMVSKEMLAELERFDTPILAVGDHGQLPPVASSGSIVEDPEVRLETIHRQAEGNPIIRLAMKVREKGLLLPKFGDGDRVRFVEKKGLTKELARLSDVNPLASLQFGMVCYTNKTRVWLNGVARKVGGYAGPPRMGEPVLCLKNYPPVFNGMRGRLTADAQTDPEGDPDRPWLLGAHVEFPDEEIPEEDYLLCGPQFNRERTFDGVDELQARGINVGKMSDAGMLFDFGYALTCHKAQGSEFELGAIYIDRIVRPHDDEWRRWCYTAVTRAKERLVVFHD